MLDLLCILFLVLAGCMVALHIDLHRMNRQLDLSEMENVRLTKELQERKANTLYTVRVHPNVSGENRSSQLACVRQETLDAFYVDAETLTGRLLAMRRRDITLMVTQLAE